MSPPDPLADLPTHCPQEGILRAGRRLGPYLLLRERGRGGMGAVWEARNERLGVAVALKFLLAGRVRVPDLAREARTLLGLTHQGIVRLHTIEEEEGLVFLVMEWLAGPDLVQLLGQRQEAGCRGLRAAEALWVLEQVAPTLDHAHAEGVLHCDLKPGNLVLTGESGEPLGHAGEALKITDFGVAATLRAGVAQGGGGAAGTPGFQAPEVAAGAAPTRRADVYSLAATLYCLVAGHPPRREPDGGSVAPLGSGDPALDAALAAGLAWDPSRRPESAGRLLELASGRAASPAPLADHIVPPLLRILWRPEGGGADAGHLAGFLGLRNLGQEELSCELRLTPPGEAGSQLRLGTRDVPAGAIGWFPLRLPAPPERLAVLGTIRILAWSSSRPEVVHGCKLPQGAIPLGSGTAEPGAQEIVELPLGQTGPFRGLLRPGRDAAVVDARHVRLDLHAPGQPPRRFRLWFRGDVYLGRSPNGPGGEDGRIVTLWQVEEGVAPGQAMERNRRISRTACLLRCDGPKVMVESLSAHVLLDGRPLRPGESIPLLRQGQASELLLGSGSPPLCLGLELVEALRPDPWQELGEGPEVSCSFLGILPPAELDGVRIQRRNNARQVEYALVFRTAAIGGSQHNLCRVPGLPRSVCRLAFLGGVLYAGILSEHDEGPVEQRGLLRPVAPGERLRFAGCELRVVPEAGVRSMLAEDLPGVT